MKNLKSWESPQWYSGQFEGDIVASPAEIDSLLNGKRGGRTGLRDERYRWTDNIVPYMIQEADFSEKFFFFF